jgi:hypothetical protein
MIVCPLCGHEQALGLECEHCGKDLGLLDALGPPPAGEERLEGLESWERAVAPADPTAEAPIADLERTAYEPAEPGVVEAGLELEPTALAADAAADVEVEVAPMVELLSFRHHDAEPPTPTAGPGDPVTCRYCRQVQSRPGLAMCERCGQRLPGAFARPARSAGRPVEVARVRCRACGAPVEPGTRCSECGREAGPSEGG